MELSCVFRGQTFSAPIARLRTVLVVKLFLLDSGKAVTIIPLHSIAYYELG